MRWQLESFGGGQIPGIIRGILLPAAVLKIPFGPHAQVLTLRSTRVPGPLVKAFDLSQHLSAQQSAHQEKLPDVVLTAPEAPGSGFELLGPNAIAGPDLVIAGPALGPRLEEAPTIL